MKVVFRLLKYFGFQMRGALGFSVLRFWLFFRSVFWFLLQKTSVFRFWCSLRFADFSLFRIWFSVFVKNTSGFSVLVPDVVFGFSYFVLFYSILFYWFFLFWYPKPDTMVSLHNVPLMMPLSVVSLPASDCDLLRNWASAYGAAVRQRTLRQETTMAKHGTSPEYLYQRHLEVGDKVII